MSDDRDAIIDELFLMTNLFPADTGLPIVICLGRPQLRRPARRAHQGHAASRHADGSG